MEFIKYTFVCDPDGCDALLEFTCRDGFDFPNGIVEMRCPCGRRMQWVEKYKEGIAQMESEKDQLVNMWKQELELTYGNRITELENRVSAWQNKAENFERLFEVYREKNNTLQSTINKIIDNLTEDYWFNPNTDRTELLNELCEIIDHTPKKEISFTATMHFSGRIDVDLADYEDFNLEEFLSDAYVDVNHGDVVIDDYELYDANEC